MGSIAIADALAGRGNYDQLDPCDQQVVRDAWSERIERARTALNLAAEFTSAGRSWVELDEHGATTARTPSPAFY